MAYKQKRFTSQYSGDCKDQGTGRFSVWGGPRPPNTITLRYYWWIRFQHMNLKWSEIAQSCPTLCNPMDCSLPGSSIHGIFPGKNTVGYWKWVAISFSRRSSRPRDWTQVSRIVGRCFAIWATRKHKHLDFTGGSVIMNLPANAEDVGSIFGWGSFPGKAISNPLQYSCPWNPMDREAWWATVHGSQKSWTQLSH